jgi:hypothetical protein
MSILNSLKDKDPKEIARLLSLTSSYILPNPGLKEPQLRSDSDLDVAQDLLQEIRDQLNVSQDDFSIKTQSRIYAFLSEEISKAAFTNVDLSNLKTRLGNKGELHPSQYQISFFDDFVNHEALGDSKRHIIDAVTQPDNLTHLHAKYAIDEFDPRVTISIKAVSGKRTEDRFILFVISHREGQTQRVHCAFRAYPSDMDLNNANEPIEIVRAFVNSYGLTLRIGSSVSKFMHNETVSIDETISLTDQWEILDGQKGDSYWTYINGGITRFQASSAEKITEVVLAFALDISRYTTTLRKHNVRFSLEAKKKFLQI